MGTVVDSVFEGRPIFNGHPCAVVDVEPFFEIDGKNIQIVRQGLSRYDVAIILKYKIRLNQGYSIDLSTNYTKRHEFFIFSNGLRWAQAFCHRINRIVRIGEQLIIG